MDDISIFQDKTITPADNDLVEKLDSTYNLWIQLQNFVLSKYPDGLSEWNYPGKKYGWSFRIKDKKEQLFTFLPRDKYFKVAFVFGQKATDIVFASDIIPEIKTELMQARKYTEGRGIRIDIINNLRIPDIKKLIEIKLAN